MKLYERVAEAVDFGLIVGTRPEVIAMHLGYTVSELNQYLIRSGYPKHARDLRDATHELAER